MADMFEEFRRFQEEMNRMFEALWGRSPMSMLPYGESGIERYRFRTPSIGRPSIDIVEGEKELVATVDMPGLEKEDIKINLTEDKLEVSAETKREEEKEEKGYIYRERSTGSYYRAVSLPTTVDPDNAKASYNNGVLEIKMPKSEIKKKIPLKVE